MRIRAEHGWLKDEYGRARILRGVNLSGNAKLPYPNGATHIPEGFFNYQNISFASRPFSLEEADEHFNRLKSWGFTFLRLLVSWEAIEHAGPGIYDEEYLDYIVHIVAKAAAQDMFLFIDPHQDCWSRFSGGDGAPGWTFDLIGMDITKFKETGAAIVHQTHGDPFPKMIWPSNWTKLATATMFTLFFAGNELAPNTQIAGEPIQEYLQRHYINAIKQVAIRLKDMPNVIGYDIMNEPVRGFIGWKDICANEARLKMGDSPTPYESILLGCGYPQSVEVWSAALPSILRKGRRTIDPQGVTVWKPGYECVWKQNSVWGYDQNGKPQALRRDHFCIANGRQIHFETDYLRPFINRYATAIREAHPNAIIFIESEPEQPPPRWRETDTQNIVYAPHWYDGLTLFTKRFFGFVTVDNYNFRPVIGYENVCRSFAFQLNRFKQWSQERLHNAPVIIGETGIPFDMHDKEAYRTGDFTQQIRALNLNMHALDANLLNATLWNYMPNNSNERGDEWNGEDLSLFSYDQQDKPDDINSGGRAIKAVVRPYAMATAGEPLEMGFDIYRGYFRFRFRHDPAISAPTEIFTPNYQFPDGYAVKVSDGEYTVDRKKQRVIYRYSDSQPEHLIEIYSQCMPLVEPGPSIQERLRGIFTGMILLGRWLVRNIRTW